MSIEVKTILGTAGAGKTTALTDLISFISNKNNSKRKYNEVWEQHFSDLELKDIAFISFSNVAIKEIAYRTGLRIKGKQGSESRYWRTITGLFEVLLYENFIINKELMEKVALIEYYRKIWARKEGLQYIIGETNVGVARAKGNEIINEYSYLVHRYYHKKTIEEIIEMHSQRKYLLSYLKFKKEKKFIDWEDIVMMSYNNREGLVFDRELKLMIIDEAQDNSVLEYMTLLHILKNNQVNLLLAGDDAQLIYDFKSADYKLFNTLIKKSEIILNLTKSHRFAENIRRIAQAILEDMDYITKRTIEVVGDRKDKVVFVYDFDKVVQLLKSDLLKDKKVFVLARTNYIAEKVLELLSKSGIIIENTDIKNKTVMTKEYEVAHLLKKLKEGKISSAERRKLYYLIINSRKDDITETLEKKAKEVFRKVILQHRLENNLKKEDLESFEWYFVRYVSSKKLNIERVYKLMNKEEGQNIYKNIYIGTIHSVKGAEADVVVIVNSVLSSTVKKLDSESEKRVAFVGVTRAKKLLIITHINDKLSRAGNRHIVSWFDFANYS